MSNGERRLIALIESGELEIDSQGRIWRLKQKAGGGCLVIKPVKRRRAERRLRGYFQVRSMENGKRVGCQAHRLVWQHFFGDIPEGYEINHINGVRDDNRPENLELTTSSENRLHSGNILKNRHGSRGEKRPSAKLTSQDVINIRARARKGELHRVIAADYEVSQQHISKIVRGIKWKHIPIVGAELFEEAVSEIRVK